MTTAEKPGLPEVGSIDLTELSTVDSVASAAGARGGRLCLGLLGLTGSSLDDDHHFSETPKASCTLDSLVH
jgi:hypothetical protein